VGCFFEISQHNKLLAVYIHPAWSGMMSLPRTYTDLNQHIEAKERELREFQDLRIAQLECFVEERDQLLLESSKRFEKLKDDFEYNLTLIQARDLEIERLEHEVHSKKAECDQFHEEVKSLAQHLEVAKAREHDIQKKAELERINHKVSTT
jgi:cell division protein FtsL